MRIPLAEEQLDISVEGKTTGSVRVSTRTYTVKDQAVADLERSSVEIHRVSIDRIVDVAPGVRTEGDLTVIPILEEVLVVEKRLVLKEEIHVRRVNSTDKVAAFVSLRKQKALISRIPSTEDAKETEMDVYTNESAGSRTLTAFFRDRADAEEATRELADAGIAQDAIRMVPGKEPDSVAASDIDTDRRGFWEALGDFFFPDDDRATYAEGLRRGGYLVTVNAASEDQHAKALHILDDEGTIDVDEWSDSWRAEGWAPTNPGFDRDRSSSDAARSQASATTEDAFAVNTSGNDIIPVVEEQLRVGKRDVNAGNVRVRSYVVETPVSETVNLRDENVSIERRAVDRPLADAESAFVDRTIEAEEYHEEAVVSKTAKVTEEVVLKKTETERTENIEDSVRHTEVEVEDNRSGQTQNGQGQSQGGQTQTWRN